MVVTYRKFKRNAEFAERCLQEFLQFPKIGRGGLFQLANDLRIWRASRAQAGIEYFVPPWLGGLSVPRHSGLLWLTGNSLSCKVGTQNCRAFGSGFTAHPRCEQRPSTRCRGRSLGRSASCPPRRAILADVRLFT